MRLLQVMLVTAMLATVAYSIPITTENQTKADFSNRTNVSVADNKKPVVIKVEEKNPNAGSLVLEVVYNGNSVTDKEKFIVDKNTKRSNNKNPYATEKASNKPVEKINDQTSLLQDKEQTSVKKVEEPTEKLPVTALNSEEHSPLVQKYPKYFYEAFNPIPPFPEQNYDSSNQIQVYKNIIPELELPYESQQKNLPDTAGPSLNPISIFNREFRVPAFD